MNKKILITGATGMLGSSLVPYLRSGGLSVIAHGYQHGSECNFDLTDFDSTFENIEKLKPATIINLVALTDVDKCERQINQAYRLNVKTVENIVACIRLNKGVQLVQISTDQVYDALGPSKEDDIKITNVYALTKYAAEIVAAKADATVLRTNFFGRSINASRKSLSDWMIENLRMKNEMNLFKDIYFTPLSIETLCKMIKVVISRRNPGIFNLGSYGGLSKYAFGIYLANELGLSTAAIHESEFDQANFQAYRPKDMQMDSSLFEKTFDVKLPELKDEIKSIRKSL